MYQQAVGEGQRFGDKPLLISQRQDDMASFQIMFPKVVLPGQAMTNAQGSGGVSAWLASLQQAMIRLSCWPSSSQVQLQTPQSKVRQVWGVDADGPQMSLPSNLSRPLAHDHLSQLCS